MSNHSERENERFGIFDDWLDQAPESDHVERLSDSKWITPEPSDAQRWQRVVDALGVIANLIREKLPSDELSTSLAAGTAAAVHADAAILRIANLDARTLEVSAVHGFDRAFKTRLLGRSGSLFDAQHVLASARSTQFNVEDNPPPGFSTTELDELTKRGISGVLIVPLLKHGVLIGRMDLLVVSVPRFSSEERTVAEAIGAVVASALSDAEALEDERSSRLAVSRLSPPSFEGISDAREMFQYLVQWLDETLETRQCYGLTWHQQKEAFSPVAVSGSRPVAVQALKQIQLRPEHVPALREAIKGDSPYVIPNARETMLFPPRMARMLDLHNVMILPLRGSSGQLVGTLLLDFPLERELDSILLGAAAHAGNYASIMLENALLYEAVQRSSENLAIVNEIGMELASLSDLDSLFKLVFYHLRSVIETTCFAVGLVLPDGNDVEYRYAIANQIAEEPITVPLERDVLSTVIKSGQTQVSLDAEAIRGAGWFPIADHSHVIRSALAVPVRVGRETIGVLVALSESFGAYQNDSLELIATVGMQLGAAIHNARLYSIVRARGERRGYLLDQFIHEQESERKMLVDSIHDHTLQTLAYCLFQLDMISRRADDRSDQEVRQPIDDIRTKLADNIDRLHETIFRLRPSSLEILGLESAVRDYLKSFQSDTGIETDLEFDVGSRQNDDVETQLYRFVQESIDRIRHREEVTRVGVRLTQRKSDIVITIADDGIGIDRSILDDTGGQPVVPEGGPEARLLRLRERAELAGGRLEVSRRSRGGSIVQVIVPIESDEE